MKIMKKVMALCLALAMVCACGINAFAAEEDIAPMETQAVSVMNPSARAATFGLEFDLGINYYSGVSTYFTLDGSEQLHFNVNWTPANQYIKIALRNVSTNDFYTLHIELGSVNGFWDISETGVPAGTYQVCVINPLDSTSEVSGIAYFYWI